MTLVNDVHKCVVVPALSALSPAIPDTVAGRALVLGTGLVESSYNALVQHTSSGAAGVAKGFWQIEPATFNDVMTNFLPYRTPLMLKLTALIGRQPVGLAERVETDLLLGAAMCRIIYFRAKEPLPAPTALGLAQYHKRVYNTSLGAADPQRNVPLFQQALNIVGVPDTSV